MKNSWIKRVVVGLLVVSMMSTSIFAARSSQVRANLKFSEMKYEHIEYAEVEALLNKVDRIIETENEEEFYKWEDEYYALYCRINTMIQISKLNYELHTNQDYYFDEYLYSIDLLGKMQTEYLALFEDEDGEEEEVSKEMERYYELSIERSKLVDNYLDQEFSVAVTVDGRQMTLIDLLEDRMMSDEQWYKAYDEWYTAYNQAVGEIFLKLVKLDNEMTKIEGYNTYAESMYNAYERDYTPQQVSTFIANVKAIVPEVHDMLYKDSMAACSVLESYNYESDASLLESIYSGFLSKHPKLKAAYEYMHQYELYDIENRAYKSTGGFTIYFDEFSEPFIMVNYDTPYYTALTFIHEFGHYFSYYEIGNNVGGLDLDETYSQALELIAMPYYNEIFKNEEYAKAARIYTMESMLNAILEGCLFDEFLQAVYQNPNMTVAEVNALYSKLAKEYGLEVDERSWCDISHNFESPFYYISYSVSAVAALQIWAKSLDKEGADLTAYLALLKAGKGNTFIKSLNAIALASPLDKRSLEKVMEAVKQYLHLNEEFNQSQTAA